MPIVPSIEDGIIVGTVLTVKKNKGKPTIMLHIERYNHGTRKST